ncbi:MAG: ribonuclease HII [Candidatus Dadabacteria bacterium]|nr:MAG: ribonuclease HII [Candidatus Dadabacteria bacterium]
MNIDPRWAGTDEVGRGCLAGPVVAAAVVFRREPNDIAQYRDSKKLSAARRQQIAASIVRNEQIEWAIAWRDPEAIDATNILRASLAAMADAVARLSPPPDGVYVDGHQMIPTSLPQQTVIGGDDRVPQIAAASILAKVFRDRWMAALASTCPGYGWERNAGYGTPEHMEALARLGPTPHHRKSFAPVRQMRLF